MAAYLLLSKKEETHPETTHFSHRSNGIPMSNVTENIKVKFIKTHSSGVNPFISILGCIHFNSSSKFVLNKMKWTDVNLGFTLIMPKGYFFNVTPGFFLSNMGVVLSREYFVDGDDIRLSFLPLDRDTEISVGTELIRLTLMKNIPSHCELGISEKDDKPKPKKD